MNKHEGYMKKALLQAESASKEDEVPVGAVIVYKDKIIAQAHNQIEKLKDPTAHAEIIKYRWGHFLLLFAGLMGKPESLREFLPLSL